MRKQYSSRITLALIIAGQFVFTCVSAVPLNSEHGTEISQKIDKRINLNRMDYALLNTAILMETNRQRTARNLDILVRAKRLEKSAQGHAKAMVDHDFFSHTSPLPKRKTLLDRLERVGIENAFAAENIAQSFVANGNSIPHSNKTTNRQTTELTIAKSYHDLALAVLQQWMGSPSHKKNILSPKYQYIGIGSGSFRDKHGLIHIKAVQIFSSKKK